MLTTAEYFEKAKNEGQKGMILGFSIGFAFCLISSIVSPGSFFEGPVDALVFFLVLAVIMYPLSRLMKGIDKIAEKEKRSILAACNAKGVELDVYYEMLVDGTLDLEEK